MFRPETMIESLKGFQNGLKTIITSL